MKILICTLVTIIITAVPLVAQEMPSSLTADTWHEDLLYLRRELPKRHKDLFHTMTQENFADAISSLDSRLSELSRAQIIVEIARIMAMIGDGHSGMRTLTDPMVGFRSYPLKVYAFKDGIFVQSVDQAFAQIVGARLVCIGATPADEAFKRVAELVPRDNQMTVRNLAPLVLMQAEVLHALGIVKNMDRAEFTFEKDGVQQTVILAPMKPGVTALKTPSHWIDARTSSPTPLWLQDVDNFYWFKYLPQAKIVYVQVNEIANKPSVAGKSEETLSEFFERVFAFIRAKPVNRFVLDLRMNGGGSGDLNLSVVHGIIRTEKIDQKGKLFVIIGRKTFSAAQNLVNELENHTRAIFVGEPTGGRPNHYGDAIRIVLPNSKISVFASTLWHQESGARDQRAWTPPQLAAELTSDDYKNNRDPAMSAILAYDPREDLIPRLTDAINRGDHDLALKRLTEFIGNPTNKYADIEKQINQLGYDLLNKNNVDEAVEILRLNVEAYPGSSNAYDSLGEAYLRKGDKTNSIANYERSLNLNPKNSNAAEHLRALRGP